MAKMQEIQDGIIKTKEPRRLMFSVDKFKKLLAGLIITATLIGSVFTFAGCTLTKGYDDLPEDDTSIILPVDPVPDDPIPDNPIILPDVPQAQEEMSVDEFISQHTDKATAFAQSALGTNMAEGVEVYDYAFGTNENGDICDIEQINIVANDDTTRTISYGKLTLSSPISPEEILDGYTTADTSGSYTQQNFVYDAKENFTRADLGKAFFDACEIEGGQSMFSERKSLYASERVFEVLNIDTETNDCVVYKITLPYAQSDEEMISLLANREADIEIVSSVDFGSYQICFNEFEMEVFEPENVADLVENYSKYVHTALNNHFFAKITKSCWGRTFEADRLIDPEWKIITNDEGKITGFKFISRYKYSEVDENLKIGKIDLATPLDVTDFTAENADEIFAEAYEKATFSMEHALYYLKDNETKRADLMNALFEAYGLDREMKEGEERYFNDDGILLYGNIGEARQFKLMHKEGDRIVALTIIMKYSENDAEMIELLKNPKNFEIFEEYIVDTSGTGIEYKDLSATMELDEELEREM